MSQEDAGRVSKDRIPDTNGPTTLLEGGTSGVSSSNGDVDPVAAGFSLIGAARVTADGVFHKHSESKGPRAPGGGKHCVYFVRRVHPGPPARPFPVARAVGETTVLYVGEGKATRPVDLFRRQHSANAKLGRLAFALSRHARDVELHVQVWGKGCKDKRAAVLAEAQLLNQIALACGETPPCNSRWEGWVTPRLLAALADVAIENSKGRATSWTAGAPYAWPRGTTTGPAGTVVDIFRGDSPQHHVRARWECSLAWVWPASWHTLRDNVGDQAVVQPERLLLVRPKKADEAGWVLPAGAPLEWTVATKVVAWEPCPLVDMVQPDVGTETLSRLLQQVERGATPTKALVPAFSHQKSTPSRGA